VPNNPIYLKMKEGRCVKAGLLNVYMECVTSFAKDENSIANVISGIPNYDIKREVNIRLKNAC
jgi:hypothetical protein